MKVSAPEVNRSRRHHTKSRKGCGVCKKRKVKCDERKPHCGNCTKYGADCDFPRAEIATSPATSSTPTPNSPSTSTPYPTPGSTGRQTNGDAPVPAVPHVPDEISSLELVHLELLHNYTTLISQTLAGDPVLRNLWRINVPNAGFSNSFVMRSIFALSALHMSLFSASKRQFYLDVARSEHGAALRDIAAVLPHVTAENCSAVYIAAVLTFLYAWAHPRQQGDFFLVNSSGTAEWVFLLKGVRGIIESWGAELRSGPFSATFRLGGSRIGHLEDSLRNSPSWLSTTEHSQLTHLRQMVGLDVAVYQDSIDNLEKSFLSNFHRSKTMSRSPGSSPSAARETAEWSLTPVASMSNVYSWLYKMSDHFIELLTQRDPPALVIFAHFCVLLKYLGSSWWMQGWPTHLLQEIWDLLDEDHRLWIRWPIEEIGWSPKT